MLFCITLLKGNLNWLPISYQRLPGSWGNLKPTPSQCFCAEGWNEMSQLCVDSTPGPVYLADLLAFTVWPVPNEPFQPGFLHRVPMASGSLSDWLPGLVVVGVTVALQRSISELLAVAIREEGFSVERAGIVADVPLRVSTISHHVGAEINPQELLKHKHSSTGTSCFCPELPRTEDEIWWASCSLAFLVWQ